MSTFSDAQLGPMSREDYDELCESARVQNRAAEMKLRHRAEHVRKGGIICPQCAHPIPRLHEDKYRGLFNGEFKPVCSAHCMAENIIEEAAR